MRIFLVFLLTLSLTNIINCVLCTEPQRSFYMSFSSLSKRDTIQNIFDIIGSKMTSIDANYTDSGSKAIFMLTNIVPRTYYNDHGEIGTYVDQRTCNVSMGVVGVSSFFDYSIFYDGTNKTGKIRVNGIIDPSFMIKKLLLTNGYLQWKPDHVPTFTFSQNFYLEYASPNITDGERNIVLQMLNNQAGAIKVKDQALSEINTKFGPLLDDHLNHEHLIKLSNIPYYYGAISLVLGNYPKDFYLSNDETKGLEVYLVFGFDNSTENCTKLPTKFDEEKYGGVQEIYTFSVVRSMVVAALQKGLFNHAISSYWEVPSFQFRMGDLANFFPYANNEPAISAFSLICKYNTSRADQLKLSQYGDHQLYLAVPETCVVGLRGRNIIQVDMDVNMVVRLDATGAYLRVVTESTGVYGLKWTSLDPNYVLSSEYVAQYAVSEVLNILVGQQVFGTNFPIIARNFPVVRIIDNDRIIIYDPSEY